MLTRDELLATFLPAPGSYRPLVGFEYEILCLDGDTLRPLAFEGERGLGALLACAARLTGGALRAEGDDPPGSVVLPDQGLLSLEPGGQLEFSSPPRETFQGAMDDFHGYLALLDELGRRFRLQFFFGGVNPVHTVEDIGLIMRKRRYRLMDAYFPRVGTMGQRMMRQTCSIQVSFDYRDRGSGEDLLRTALYIAPFAGALFSNSPFVDGQLTGYRSFRVPIWAGTDRARTGLIPGFTRPDFGFQDYLDHLQKAPMFFVRTEEGLKDCGGLTFEAFNREGFLGRSATLDDFRLHNSTLFTDVRLKTTVEVRTVDSQDPSLFPSVLAFLCGILFCERARLRARLMLGSFSCKDYMEFPDRLARDGVNGMLGEFPVKEILLGLVDLARMGLPTCFPDGAEAAHHLDPIRALIEEGKTPADRVLEHFDRNPWAWLRAGRLPA